MIEVLDKPAQISLKNYNEAKISYLDTKIQRLEEELGLNSSLDVAIEASLLVDFKFVQAAVIRGDKNVERLFGKEAWADWLQAREFTRSNLEATLTPELIIESHSCR